MEEIENGIHITHEWLGRKQVIEFVFTDGRLQITADKDANSNNEVYLTEEETGYVLAWMATWYGLGDSPLDEMIADGTIEGEQ